MAGVSQHCGQFSNELRSHHRNKQVSHRFENHFNSCLRAHLLVQLTRLLRNVLFEIDYLKCK